MPGVLSVALKYETAGVSYLVRNLAYTDFSHAL